MKFIRNHLYCLFIFCLAFAFQQQLKAQLLPQGFIDQVHSSAWNNVTGFEFDKNGQMYVYDKKGHVWVIDTTGMQLTTPLLDISDEVGSFGDNGLLGFCLHPDFLNNGLFYLFYAVDRYNLFYAGTPGYDSTINWYNEATICRVTRYKADAATNFHTLIAGSRQILLGDKKTNGVPLVFIGHSGGQIRFGNDTSLLISTGDGASYSNLDTGSTTGTYWAQALADSIIRPAENVGAFRSLMMNSYCGKILRIDPNTGLGLNSNPYYVSSNPDSIVSKVWALGFRNPFRFTIIPNTGSTDITAGDPGVLFVGDVGYNTWESLDIVKQAGQNSGWPLFEGLTAEFQYYNLAIQNLDAPNPLFGSGSCMQQYFTFKDLTVLDKNFGNPVIKNPCDTTQLIPASCYPMPHHRPQIEWKHQQNITRCPLFTGQGNPISVNINQPTSPVQGVQYAGNASVGGVYYDDNRFPVEFQNNYFHGDYGAEWIRRFTLDSAYNLLTVDSFATGVGPVVFLNRNPKTGCLMYVKYPDEIHSICYTGNVNNPPKAIAKADTFYTPLNSLLVNFDGLSSTDPENMPLQYEWDFGDGSAHDFTATPQHTYSTPFTNPVYFDATLTVTDDTNQTSTAKVRVHLNNTPPLVNITSPAPGYLYPIHTQSLLQLNALVSDQQTPNSLLHYSWQVTLHHNSHTHPESADTSVSPQVIITPVGCDTVTFETYFYRIELTVTDPQGLKGHDSRDIYADCTSPVNELLNANTDFNTVVFPNPVLSDNFFVLIRTKSPTNQPLQLSVFDLTGKQVFAGSYENVLSGGEIIIPVNQSLSEGIYILRASDGKNFSHFRFQVVK